MNGTIWILFSGSPWYLLPKPYPPIPDLPPVFSALGQKKGNAEDAWSAEDGLTPEGSLWEAAEQN
jgi:hypothetical protein